MVRAGSLTSAGTARCHVPGPVPPVSPAQGQVDGWGQVPKLVMANASCVRDSELGLGAHTGAAKLAFAKRAGLLLDSKALFIALCRTQKRLSPVKHMFSLFFQCA